MESVFMFFCTLLVWLMTPGIALFYGGMVRRKNVLSTQCIVLVRWQLFLFFG